jgi:hypothetical protein
VTQNWLPESGPYSVSAIDPGSLEKGAAALPASGGVLALQPGHHSVEGPLALDKPLTVLGHGAAFTSIENRSLGPNDDALTITPSPSFSHTLMRLEGVALHDPTNGRRPGAVGIALNTTAPGHLLPKFTLRDVSVGQGGGSALHHRHLPQAGPQGGLYGALIQNCVLKGGVILDGSGDSNSIVHCILSGGGIGVNAGLTARASLLEVASNNITNAAGAFRLTSGSRFLFHGNNCENRDAGALRGNGGAVVNISGQQTPIVGGLVTGNLISAFGRSDATCLLRLDNCSGTLVADNVFLAGTRGVTGIEIGAGCRDVRIAANAFNEAVQPAIVDYGVGTMGVAKSLSLEQGWHPAQPASPPQFMKEASGLVTVWGETQSLGTSETAFILPEGFRPLAPFSAPTVIEAGGEVRVGRVKVAADGVTSIAGAKRDETVSLALSFGARNLGHSISPE